MHEITGSVVGLRLDAGRFDREWEVTIRVDPYTDNTFTVLVPNAKDMRIGDPVTIRVGDPIAGNLGDDATRSGGR